MEKLKSREDLEALRRKAVEARRGKRILSLCSGTGCMAKRSQEVYEALLAELERNKAPSNVAIKRTGCHGLCEKGPIIVIYPEETCYLNVRAEDAGEIVAKTVLRGEPVERLLWKGDGEVAARQPDIPFYRHQTRRVIANNPLIDPKDIEDYIGYGGYSALARVLFEMTPQQVIEEIKESNLRGRGGGGFPAGVKWEATRSAPDPVKYVIVNGDEGDPGAFMDQSILEGTPQSVLEGLIIGARAIGAREGFFYIRQEYPRALETILTAIEQAEAYGLLGDDILGSGFEFRVKVHQGAGAFVSGESSALVSAIEGRVGEPRLKYIRQSTSGLWGKPTCLNNVETWANVPLIVNGGAERFRKVGNEKSSGTKIFSLVGQVRNTGLVEVPMGATLRQIIFDIGGGIKDGRRFKAVQTGGPSGGCIPEAQLDVPVDFDALTALGSMMGSGGMIVMDETSCMVDVARYFVEFLKEESCGKCLPCREGIGEMVTILNRIVRGLGEPGDLDFLEDISVLLSEASLCGLGTSAANPVMSTIRYFRDEYEAHIRDRTCPAKVCKALTATIIDERKCQGCTACARQCPVKAIEGKKGSPHSIDQKTCIRCGICFEACKKNRAIDKVSPASAVTSSAAS
jgi:NADH-quinone oxidoreductase subunit F